MNDLIKGFPILENTNALILFSTLILTIVIIVTFNYFLKKEMLKSGEMEFPTFKDALFVVHSKRPNIFHKIIMIFFIFMCNLLFYICLYLKLTIPLNIFMFLLIPSLLLIIKYINSFLSQLVITKNSIIYKNFSTLFRSKQILFYEIKHIDASYTHGLPLRIFLTIERKGKLPVTFMDISEGFIIKETLDSLIFTDEDLKEQQKLIEKINEKTIIYIVIFLLLMPFAILLLIKK